jgi:ATP-binding cassette, subfamily B, bacterial
MKLPISAYIKLLSKYLKRQRKQLLILFIILIGSIAIQLLNPQIIRYFIDNATKTSNNGKGAGSNTSMLTLSALVFIGAAFLVQLLNMAATYLSQNIGWISTNSLRIDLIEHCIKLDMDFHKNHQAGELLERVDGDINSLFNFFSKFILSIFNNAVLLIGILFLLVRENLLIGLSLSAFVAIAMLVLWLLQSRKASIVVAYRQESAKLFGFLGEQISSTEDIRSNGAKPYVMNSYFTLLRKLLPLRIGSAMNYYNMWSSTLLIFSVGNAIAFGLSAYLWKANIISIGTVYLIFYYTELLIGPIEQLRSEMQDLQKSNASIMRIQELFEITSKLEEGNESFHDNSALNLKLSNVSFNYDGGENALDNVTFELGSGKILGVIGHSGSGKTTLARLLARLYDATSGDVLLNGTSIKAFKLEELRKNIAYVTQEVQLFKASIRDNLTMFNKEIQDTKILEALYNFGLKSWYEALPNGLDTLIEANGTGLSAGEAQLLAFVRVFLKNPSFIILDEATSRLDPITEQLVENALNKLLLNRTSIVIAHRLWTVQRADQILILENGNISEFGNRKALLSDTGSKFYNLLQKGIDEVLV